MNRFEQSSGALQERAGSKPQRLRPESALYECAEVASVITRRATSRIGGFKGAIMKTVRLGSGDTDASVAVTIANRPPEAIDGLLSAPRLLSPKETARHLGVSVQTLAIWRCKRRYNLPFVRIGRLIKYQSAVVAAHMKNGIGAGD